MRTISDSTPECEAMSDDDSIKRLARLEAAVEYIRDKVDEVASMITVVSRMEADLTHHREAMGRAFVRIEKLELRMDQHEKDQVASLGTANDRIDAVDSKLKGYATWIAGAMVGAGLAWGIFALFVRADLLPLLEAIANKQ